MAHSYGNHAAYVETDNPVSIAVVPASGATVLVVTLVTASAVDRAGGPPTLGGVALTQADVARKYATSPECSAELWYMLSPPAAGGTLLIPNTNGEKIFVNVSSFVAGTGMKSQLSGASGGTGITANPRVPITPTRDGSVIVCVLASGNGTVPSAQAGTSLGSDGNAAMSAASQYYLQSIVAEWPATGVNNWTTGADDWGVVVAAFIETVDTSQVTPELTVVALLDALSVYVRGTNLFEGPVRAQSSVIPHRAAFVISSGGPASDPYADGTTTEMKYSAVQVRVRSNPHDFAGGQILARQTRSALHHASVAGYVDIRVMQSEPIYLGPDEEDRHEWSINMELWRET